MSATPASYAELVAATAFSFLRGASLAEEMVAQASAFGLSALGVADRNTVAGVVRAHTAARKIGLPLLVGSRLVFADHTPDLAVYPQDRAAWGRLTRLLTLGKSRVRKGECHLTRPDLFAYAEGQVVIALPPEAPSAAFTETLAELHEVLRGRLYLGLSQRRDARDGPRVRYLVDLAHRLWIPTVATNDALYHVPERRALHDVMTAIRLGTTVKQAAEALLTNTERHLKPHEEITRLFREHPPAVPRTREIVERVGFSLDQISYEYPDEPVPPGRTPDEHLAFSRGRVPHNAIRKVCPRKYAVCWKRSSG